MTYHHHNHHIIVIPIITQYKCYTIVFSKLMVFIIAIKSDYHRSIIVVLSGRYYLPDIMLRT